MNCQSCHLNADRTWKFCPQCGCILERMIKCQECQTMVDRKWKYCHECGSSMISRRRKVAGSLLDKEHVDAFIERAFKEKGERQFTADAHSHPSIWQAFTSGNYASAVRQQVFEVIVRQAIAGAPWQEICRGPMNVNNISIEEVQVEVRRRRGLPPEKGIDIQQEQEDEKDDEDNSGGGGLHTAPVPKKPIPPTKGELIKLPLPKTNSDEDDLTLPEGHST